MPAYLPVIAFPDGAKDLAAALLALGVFFALLITGRFLKRIVRIPLGWTYYLFAAALAIVCAATYLRVAFPGLKESELVALICGALLLNALLYRFVWPLYGYPGEKARVPVFLPQVAAILLVVTCGFIGLAILYQITIPGLLAGSGVVAIILGLALQDTLGNIFAGFGLQASKSYRVGDWLMINQRIFEVIEINWRSTRFRNNDEISVTIPNSQLARETITNLYFPTPLHATRIQVEVEYAIPPNEVKAALVQAARAVPGILATPKPEAFLTDFAASAITYDLRVWLNEARVMQQITDRLRTNCWYEFSRRDIPFAFPVRVVEMKQPEPETDRTSEIAQLLGRQSIFSTLARAQLEHLARHAKRGRFGKTEQIIREGEPGSSMFVLARGSAEVLVHKESQDLTVGNLTDGDCFGEISFLTGEKRSATVVATTDCEVLEIPKNAMSQLLHEQPELAEKLTETLVTRRQLTATEIARFDLAAQHSSTAELRAGFLRRLRLFFEL